MRWTLVTCTSTSAGAEPAEGDKKTPTIDPVGAQEKRPPSQATNGDYTVQKAPSGVSVPPSQQRGGDRRPPRGARGTATTKAWPRRLRTRPDPPRPLPPFLRFSEALEASFLLPFFGRGGGLIRRTLEAPSSPSEALGGGAKDLFALVRRERAPEASRGRSAGRAHRGRVGRGRGRR